MHSATNIHCIHYADNSTLFTPGDYISVLTNFFNNELIKVFKWLCAYYLCHNADKSCFTINTNKNIDLMSVIDINNII